MGAFVSVLGMTALVYGVVRSASVGWGDLVTLVAVFGAVALLTFFVFHEARANQPILPLRLFASRERTAAYAARLLFLGGMVAFWFFTTQFLQLVLHYTPFQAGMAFLPTTLPNFVAAMMVPSLTRRFGNGRVLAAGIGTAVVGMAWLAQAHAGASYWLAVALPMVLIGVGQGATLGPLTVAGVSGVEPQDAGAASGLINAAHQLGGSLGLAVLVVVFGNAGARGLSGDAALAHRIGAALTGSALMLAVALAVVLLLIVRPTRRSLLTPIPR